MSRRMGSPKPLLDFGGRPLIARIIESLRAVEQIAQIVIVTGHQAQEVARACSRDARVASSSAAVNVATQALPLRQIPINFVYNSSYEIGGMISSVQTAVRAVADVCEAFFIVPGDHCPPRP